LVNVTASFSGPGSSDSEHYSFWVDGMFLYSGGGSTGGYTLPIDTTVLSNGTHVIAVSATDSTQYTNYSCGANVPVQGSGEWSATITVSNSGNPTYLRMNAHELFLQPGQSVQLSGSVVYGDGATSTRPLDYYVKSGNCTVNPSGLVTAAPGPPCQIRAMVEIVSGTDLTAFGAPSVTSVVSSMPPFSYGTVGNMIRVTGGNG
jgi:hypothetical protein